MLTIIIFVLAVINLVLLVKNLKKTAALKKQNKELTKNLAISRQTVKDQSDQIFSLKATPTPVVVNNFEGGLLGNPERQAKKVLDVLEVAGSRRYEEAKKKADEDLDSIVKASQAAIKATNASGYNRPVRPNRSSDSSLPLHTPSAFDSGSSYSSGSSSSSSCGSSSSSSSSSDSGSSSSGGCD